MTKHRNTFLRFICGTLIIYVACLALMGGYFFVADRYLDIHGDKGPVVAFVYFGGGVSVCYFVFVLFASTLWFFLRDRSQQGPKNDA